MTIRERRGPPICLLCANDDIRSSIYQSTQLHVPPFYILLGTAGNEVIKWSRQSEHINMPILQFTPLQSRPSASFWTSLSALKLDSLKLDDSLISLTGYLDEGTAVRDRTRTDEQSAVWVGGSLRLDESSLEEPSTE